MSHVLRFGEGLKKGQSANRICERSLAPTAQVLKEAINFLSMGESGAVLKIESEDNQFSANLCCTNNATRATVAELKETFHRQCSFCYESPKFIMSLDYFSYFFVDVDL